MSLCLTVSFLLSGCSVPRNTNVRETPDPVEIELSWWGNDTRHEYTINGLELFNQKNPDIDVQFKYGVWDGYEKRNAIAMVSNTESDVMQINYAWLKTYSPDGTGYYDLNELSDIIDLNNFSEKDLSYGTVNGHLNALPIAYNTTGFFYNEKLFEKYGLELPKTWDDLFNAAKVMSKDDIYLLGASTKQLFIILTAWYEQQSGSALFSEDGKLISGNEAMKKMLEFYKKLVDEKVIIPVDEYDSNSFTLQKVAGIACWINEAEVYYNNSKERNVRMVLGPFPEKPGAKRHGWYIKPATMYAISKSTDHPKEAGKLLNYLLNDKDMARLQLTEKGVPVSISAFTALVDEPHTDTFAFDVSTEIQRQRNIFLPMVPEIEYSSTYSTFKNEADKYLYQRQSLSLTAENIAATINNK